MRLVHSETGAEARVGGTVENSDHEIFTIVHFAKPHKPSSSGKITVRGLNGGTREYYVGIFGLEWIEREDQT